MKQPEKHTLVHVSNPSIVDLWLMSQDLGWSLKFQKGDAILYVNNLSKPRLKKLAQLIYERTGIMAKADR